VAQAGQVTVVNRVDPEDRAAAATEATVATAAMEVTAATVATAATVGTAAMARAVLVSQVVPVDPVGPVSRVVPADMIPVDPEDRLRAPNPGRPAAPNQVVRVHPAAIREATDLSPDRARPVPMPTHPRQTTAPRLPMPAHPRPTPADRRTAARRRWDPTTQAVGTCRAVAATRAAATPAAATRAAATQEAAAVATPDAELGHHHLRSTRRVTVRTHFRRQCFAKNCPGNPRG
jgi:hypothetical protein